MESPIRVVKEYLLFSGGESVLEIPHGARVLSVSPVKPRIFILCDPSQPLIKRKFMVIESESPFDETKLKCDYHGTFVYEGRAGHVIELV